MFFLQLSTLNSLFPPQHIDAFGKYLSSLSPHALTLITAQKLSSATKINYDDCMAILKACIDLGFMNKRYALCCPECNGYLKITDSIDALVAIDETYCPRCEESYSFDETNLSSNIEIVFSLKEDFSPFVEGQQPIRPSIDTEGQAVALTKNLTKAVQLRIIDFGDLFSPTEAEYLNLEQQICAVRQPQSTSVSVGATLESLCNSLFGLCKIFKTTTKFKSDTHQIDTFVRIASYIPNGLFGITSNYFVVECKNEKRTPKGDYLSKLHSTLHTMGGKLGIIVSKMPTPKTYPKLAHDFYLKDDICFIWFNLQELEALIKERRNLLEAIDIKILELKTNSTQPFSALGLT